MKYFILIVIFSISGIVKASIPPVESLLRESEGLAWKISVRESVVINAPVDQVWKYASDSTQAVNWSVYFDHISPLAGGFSDGLVGSLRRSFRNKNEKGEYWDEIVTEVQNQKLRQIVTYNFTNYPLRFVHKNEYVFVRQHYQALDEKTSKLSFETFHREDAGFWFKTLFSWTRNETSKIFKMNLENIKAAVEGKERIHLWEK